MQFGRVHGRAFESSSCGPGSIAIAVMLEEGSRTSAIRQECVRLPALSGHERDLHWWADQFTQETIGTTLAEAGWEAVAESSGDPHRASVDEATVTYVVRRA